MTRKLFFAAILAGVATAMIGTAPYALAGPGYANCAEANDAGEYAIPESDPAYRASLDWDGDGYACEDIEKKPATADFR